MEKSLIKEQLLNHLHELLNKKIETLQQYIQLAKESRDNETKSSVGDKYETGRAMVQMELEKNQSQLNQILNQKNELEKIDVAKLSIAAEFGAIIITNLGNYFLSIGIGRIEMDNKSWFCISISSAAGQVLYGKETGDVIQFQGKEIEIQMIL